MTTDTETNGTNGTHVEEEKTTSTTKTVPKKRGKKAAAVNNSGNKNVSRQVTARTIQEDEGQAQTPHARVHTYVSTVLKNLAVVVAPKKTEEEEKESESAAKDESTEENKDSGAVADKDKKKSKKKRPLAGVSKTASVLIVHASEENMLKFARAADRSRQLTSSTERLAIKHVEGAKAVLDVSGQMVY